MPSNVIAGGVPVSLYTVFEALCNHVLSLKYSRVTLIENGRAAIFTLAPDYVRVRGGISGRRKVNARLILRFPVTGRGNEFRHNLKTLKQAYMSDTFLRLSFPDRDIIFSV